MSAKELQHLEIKALRAHNIGGLVHPAITSAVFLENE